MPSSDSFAIHNADVITTPPSQPRAWALAVRDVRMFAVGDWADVLPHRDETTGPPVDKRPCK
jgi:predicted amidohydrolase YtcJ